MIMKKSNPNSPRMNLIWKKDYVELSLKERFLPHIQIIDNGCWNWTNGRDKEGYGFFCFNGKTMRAHRFIFQYYLNVENTSAVVDHICRNTSCVNPKHLEFVTVTENTLRGNNFSAINSRKTNCIHGHPLNGDNLYVKPKGERQCRMCARISDLKHNKKCKDMRKMI